MGELERPHPMAVAWGDADPLDVTVHRETVYVRTCTRCGFKESRAPVTRTYSPFAPPPKEQP